jgi:predicted dehydrogenase
MAANIGIVGLGLMGTNHAERLEQAGATIAGGVDVSQDARERFEERFDASCYEAYDDLYATDVDAVVVTVPNALHEAAAVAALDAGLDVLVEKPVAHTLESAERIADAARDAPGFCMTGFTMRFYPEVVELVDRIADGEFGRITHVEAHYLRRNHIPQSGWFVDPDLAGGGALVDVGVHVLHLGLAAAGFPDVEGVFGQTRTDRFDVGVETSATALARGDGELTVSLDVAWATPGEPDKSVVVRGTEGAARLDVDDRSLTVYADPDTDEAEPTVVQTADSDWLAPEDEAFLDAVERGTPPAMSGIEEGLAVQRVIDAVYRSAASGQVESPR